jgi:hypothetical protein
MAGRATFGVLGVLGDLGGFQNDKRCAAALISVDLGGGFC